MVGMFDSNSCSCGCARSVYERLRKRMKSDHHEAFWSVPQLVLLLCLN